MRPILITLVDRHRHIGHKAEISFEPLMNVNIKKMNRQTKVFIGLIPVVKLPTLQRSLRSAFCFFSFF